MWHRQHVHWPCGDIKVLSRFIRFFDKLLQFRMCVQCRWLVLGLGDTLMDNSFKENACDEKTNFQSFRSAELLSLFSLPIYLHNPCKPRYISKYISNYFPPDKYWHSFTYKTAANCWSECLILQTNFTHNSVNTNVCYLVQQNFHFGSFIFISQVSF